MHTVTTGSSGPASAGGSSSKSVGGPPGAPHGTVPWWRMRAAMAAGVAGASGSVTAGTVQARRSSATGDQATSRNVSKSSPGARSDEARVQSVPSEMRLEMAAAPSTGRAAQVRPTVSRTHPPRPSTIRNDEKYESVPPASQGPPWPCRPSSVVTTSRASSAVRPRSSPRRTRSMPVSAGRVLSSSRVVQTRSLPMATPRSFTPCSRPHSQSGRDPSTRSAPVSGRARYWVRTSPPTETRAIAPGGDAETVCAVRPGSASISWTSLHGRSELLAKRVRPSSTRQTVSHMGSHARPGRGGRQARGSVTKSMSDSTAPTSGGSRSA